MGFLAEAEFFAFGGRVSVTASLPAAARRTGPTPSG